MKHLTITTSVLCATLAFALVAPAHADKRERGAGLIERFDTNKSGSISAEEFITARTSHFDTVDADGDGELTRDELVARMERRKLERRADRMIRRMDLNGDGKVTKAETENRARKRFALMDRDDSGALEQGEVRKAARMMKRGAKGDKRKRSQRRNSDGSL